MGVMRGVEDENRVEGENGGLERTVGGRVKGMREMRSVRERCVRGI